MSEVAPTPEEMRRLAEGYAMKPTKRPCERCGAEVVMTTLGFMGCEGCRFPSKHCQCYNISGLAPIAVLTLVIGILTPTCANGVKQDAGLKGAEATAVVDKIGRAHV